MSLVEDIREVEVFEKEESRHTQVSGVGVIEDVPVKIVLGVEARWPVSTSPIVCASTHTKNYSSTCLLLQTRSSVAIRCVTLIIKLTESKAVCVRLMIGHSLQVVFN